MNKGDFIKTNIQELTKKTQQKWFLKSVEFLDAYRVTQTKTSQLSFILFHKNLEKNSEKLLQNNEKCQ